MEELRQKLQTFLSNAIIWIARTRTQQISFVDNQLPGTIQLFENLLQYEIMQSVADELLENFQIFMDAYENRDYVLAADYLESGLVEPLKQVVAELITEFAEIQTPEGYLLEYTATAAVTLSKTKGSKMQYLHTNNCPLEEGAALASKWHQDGVTHYIIAGLGLGYHVVMLASNPLIKVTVFEEDEMVIELCKKYSDVKETLINPENFEIIQDPGYQQFAETAKRAELRMDTEKVCLYYPSIQTIQSEKLRDSMGRLFMQLDNASRWSNSMKINFSYNKKSITHYVDELEEKIKGKTVYLIAGGPSLDRNISLLSERKKGELVLTVGTSLRRCLQEDVKPDYAIITDPKQYVYPQIAGLQECMVPLILLSTAFANVTRDYRGEKYLACQKGYTPAEQYAKEHGLKTFASGSSVVTSALDICIQLGAKRIVFLGLDLAFTGGKSHHGQSAVMKDTGLTVESIDGSQIPTSKNLNLYREWIERRIAQAKKDNVPIKFIDASEGGAKVKGTEIMTLVETLTN